MIVFCYLLCCFSVAGGLDIKTQEAALRQSPDIVIATPGRLIDHLRNAPSFNLANIEVLVLDEADRYFITHVTEVVHCFVKLFPYVLSLSAVDVFV